ncbi:hypothetical protein [Nonlabens ulvanivorans]|uniref:hypothetical protein n=1 Tax=Nonlabens ulvanivorans TaxID=906888 RepID=UPI003298BD82
MDTCCEPILKCKEVVWDCDYGLVKDVPCEGSECTDEVCCDPKPGKKSKDKNHKGKKNKGKKE